MIQDSQQLKTPKNLFLIPISYLVLIWLIYWVEIQFDFNFNKLGVYPRTISGLKGVLFSHFIHGSVGHLFNNSVPLFVLLTCLFYFYREVAYKVLIFGGLLTGFITWSIARESYHIGASGIVYLLFSFVFFSGIIKKHYRLVALSFVVIFLYGSMVWYVLPIKNGMSWEGHLAGFLTGLTFAFIFKNKGIIKEDPVFEITKFDLLFDENGNYNPPEEKKEVSEN